MTPERKEGFISWIEKSGWETNPYSYTTQNKQHMDFCEGQDDAVVWLRTAQTYGLNVKQKSIITVE